MNKKDARIVEAYERSQIYSLHDAYGRFSEAKRNAWEYCKKLKEKHGGMGLKVIGANTHEFSAGFLFTDENQNECLMYITRSHDRKIMLGIDADSE